MKKKNSKLSSFLLERSSREIFEAKQKIAIEMFGEIFEDETFFELELAINRDLDRELNREYNRRVNIKTPYQN